MAKALVMYAERRAGDLLIANCAFASFVPLALIVPRKCARCSAVTKAKSSPSAPGESTKATLKESKALPTSLWLESLNKHDQLFEYP